MDIKGSVAIVSGGASGLGAACVSRLLELGARGVVILDSDEQRGHALVQELGERCLFANTDVSDLAAVENAVEQTRNRFGDIHVVIAAAGIALPSKLLTKNGPIPMEKFDRVIKVNLYGTLHLIRSVATSMIKNPPNEDGERGVLINVSSGAAYEGQIGQIAYAASKAALSGFTFPLMRELAEYGIRVMTIAPGAFETPIYDTIPPSVKEGMIQQFLFPKRMAKASEFALLIEEIIRNPIHNGRTYRFDAGNILSPK